MEYRVMTGIVTGRGHLLYGLNCQDSFVAGAFEHSGHSYNLGILADGCSEGKKSETGAHLAVHYLATSAKSLITSGVPVNEIPGILFENLLGYITELVHIQCADASSYTEVVSFVKDYLLFTISGYLIGPDTTVIFTVGDGIIAYNDFVDVRDEDDRPSYPAYHVIDKTVLVETASELTKGFDTYVVPSEELQCLALGSDAWKEDILEFRRLMTDPSVKSVQRRMNVMSAVEKRLYDDATLIVVRKCNTFTNSTQAEGV